MPWIEVVEPDQAEGPLAQIYQEVRGRRGQIANIYKIHSLNPGALKGHLDLYLALLYRKGGLSRAQREMIGVAVSGRNGCHYCVVHHAEALARYEKDPRVMDRLPVDFQEAPVTTKDRALLAYCDKLTRSPAAMGREDVETLREAGFADAEILDINLIASYFNFVNRVVLGLGVDLEEAGERQYRY